VSDRTIAVAIALMAVSGCFLEGATREELVGAYVAVYSFGQTRLHLDPDGRFRQELTVGDRKLHQSGTWTYDAEGRRLTLDQALFPDDGYGNPRPDDGMTDPGLGVYPVERGLFGSIRLGPDEGAPYRKE
jgi:hypothetical protein